MVRNPEGSLRRTDEPVAVARQPVAPPDVEPQVVALVGGGALVAVQQDHEADVLAHPHRHVGPRLHRHRQGAAVHGGGGVAGQHDPVEAVQDDLGGRDLHVGAAGAVHHQRDGAEVGPLVLVAAGGRRGAHELPVNGHA